MDNALKRILGAFMLVVLLVAVSACGSANEEGPNEEPGSAEPGNEPITLTFLIDNQTERDGLEAVAQEIEERYNIVTEFELRPGGSEGDNLVKTRLATGDMADLMWYNSGALFQALNPERYFVDLTDEPFMQRVADAFKEVVSVDGRVYGIPGETAVAGGWLYNIKVYEELGLEIPRTWAELMDNLEQIEAAGKIAVAASFGDSWTSQLPFLADYYNVHSQLPEFADLFTHNQAKIAETPLVLKGFEKTAEVYQPRFVNADYGVATYENALTLLAEGEAVHYPMLTFALNFLASNFPEVVNDIGFFGQPGDDPDNHGITLWMPGGIYLNKDSDHVEAGLQWMEFFLSDEGMQIYFEHMQPLGPAMVEGVELPADVYTAVQQIQQYLDEGKVAPALEFLSPLKGPNLEQITVEVGLGMLSPEEGAARYGLDVENHARQLGIEGW